MVTTIYVEMTYLGFLVAKFSDHHSNIHYFLTWSDIVVKCLHKVTKIRSEHVGEIDPFYKYFIE